MIEETLDYSMLFSNVFFFSFLLNTVQSKNRFDHLQVDCPVDWGCRLHRLHLCRGVRPLNECPGYDTKQFDGEVLVML